MSISKTPGAPAPSTPRATSRLSSAQATSLTVVRRLSTRTGDSMRRAPSRTVMIDSMTKVRGPRRIVRAARVPSRLIAMDSNWARGLRPSTGTTMALPSGSTRCRVPSGPTTHASSPRPKDGRDWPGSTDASTSGDPGASVPSHSRASASSAATRSADRETASPSSGGLASPAAPGTGSGGIPSRSITRPFSTPSGASPPGMALGS